MAQLVGLQHAPQALTQAGVMIRETLNPGATNASVAYWNEAMNMQVRTKTGANAAYQSHSLPGTPPVWVKLTRAGNSFTGYGSLDGVNWTYLGNQTISMAQTVYAGLAVSGDGYFEPANFFNVSVTPTPSILSVTPTIGPIGTPVTITGSNFGTTQGNNSAVQFNGAMATSIISWSSSQIVAAVPGVAPAGTGPVTVTVNKIPSTGSAQFTVLNPVITSLVPPAGPVGGTVAVNGSGFGAYQNGVVSINGVSASAVSWSDTLVQVTIPGATSGPVTVSNNGIVSNSLPFTVSSSPAITGLSANSGVVGTLVTISGSGFDATQSNSIVAFGGMAALASSWSNSQVIASVPPNAITGPVTVTVAGVTAQGPSFTVAFAMALTSSANPSTFNIPLTFTATVTPLAATGTVKFKDGSTTLGTKTISNGVASYSISTLAAGSHSITAVYSGNGSYPSSTSPTLTQSVMTVASVAVTPASLSLPLGSVERYIATAIHPDGSMQTIPGGVTWSSSSTSIGTIDTTGLLTAVGQGQTTIQATFNSVAGSTGLTVGASSFRSAGSLNTSRTGHTATLLPNGKVLIAGGENNLSSGNDTTLASCEIYDPVSQTFSLTGSLNSARTGHAAMLLPSGKVLIAGGQLLNPIYGVMVNVLTLELYDPATGTFSQLPGTLTHSPASAALLNNGMVLFFGYDVNSLYPEQLYDPSTGIMNNTGDSVVVQTANTATLLNDGTVLLAGGYSGIGNLVPAAVAELYAPATGVFASTGNLLTSTVLNTSTLLNNGMVLVAGGGNLTGSNSSWVYLNGAELYNPTTKTFAATASLALARVTHTATLLDDGTVLVIGGSTMVSPNITGSAELFDPSNLTFTGDGSLVSPRFSHTATLLNDGTVLVAGGSGSSGLSLATAELYAPPLPVPTSIQITPAITTMVVGQTQQFEVLDQLGHQRFDITWNVSNPNIVWMIPVNPMILTASGEGQVTLTATVAGVSAQLQIAITPSWMQVTPATVNMWVTGTQQFTAVDNLGNPATNVTWTVSDSTLGTITTGNPAVLTATAAGNVTLTATVEGVSAQAQIAISPIGVNLPPGSVLWSVPPVPGYSAMQIAQAVPTSDGPDLYSIQLSVDGTQSVVQALKADGEQMWQSKLPAVTKSSVPDGFGGLIVTEYDTCTPGQTNPMTIAGLNPQTGQPLWEISAAAVQYGQQTIYCYPSGPGGAPQIAVRGDGAVIISEPTNNGLPPVMMVGGPSQGVYSIPTSTSTNAQGVTIDVQCCTGPPMVNSDGTAYLEYEVRNIGSTKMISDTLYLFQINPDNSSKSTVLSSTTQNEALLPGPIIPDGQGGILATWTISPSIGPLPQYPHQAADVVSGQVGTPYNLPFSPKTLESGKSPTLVLGENGVAFGAGSSTTTDGTNTAVDQIASFNVTTGAPNWTYQTVAQNKLAIITSTVGNGLVAKISDQSGNDTVIRFDSFGNATADARSTIRRNAMSTTSSTMIAIESLSGSFSNLSLASTDTFAANSAGDLVMVSADRPVNVTPNESPQPGGNKQGQNASPTPYKRAMGLLANTNLKAKAKCGVFLSELAKIGNESEDTLISELQGVAFRGQDYLYDGPSDNSDLDPQRFPDTKTPARQTIAQYFVIIPFDWFPQALSQVNGDAIWLRTGDWKDLFSSYDSIRGKPSAYGMGTVMHESLHKRYVRGRTPDGPYFTHEDMNAALGKAGAPHREQQSQNEQSYGIASICF